MTNSGKLFTDELTEWLLEAVFIQSQCHMYIYYKYAPDATNNVVLYYVDDCVYWYTAETLGKWVVDDQGKILHLEFLGYEYWFVSIRISHMKDHSISIDKAIYATSIVAKYLDTDTVKTSTKFYNTTLTSDLIFAKSDVSTSDDQVEMLTKEIKYSLQSLYWIIDLFLSKRVYLSFSVHKLAKFSSNPDKAHFEGLVNLLRDIRDDKNYGLKYYDDTKDAPLYNLLRQASIKTSNPWMALSDSS